jgi:DNA-binding IclR family transcriptional regulator
MANLETYKIKVLEKLLRILELFDEKGKQLTASEIYQILGLNKSTVFRILNILEESSYLERDPITLRYRLGFKIYFLGSLVEGYSEIRKLAHPFLENLNKTCNETVQLVILDRGEAFYLDKLEGERPIRVVSKVGQRLPPHCVGVGKVLLASLPKEALDKIIREKHHGYAIDNEEIEPGLRCLAVPLNDSEGKVIAAISIAAPKERFGNEVIDRLIPVLKNTSSEISKVFERKNLKQDCFE